MNRHSQLKIRIFADGANKKEILELNQNPFVKGFTTNPSLMKKAGITDYLSFSKEVLSEIKDKPFSLEVFADDLSEMERQAKIIASLGDNVYVKIPVMNTKKESTAQLVSSLSSAGIKINITAVFTVQQSLEMVSALKNDTPAFLSVFAGRLADTGIDPVPLVAGSVGAASMKKNVEVLWASTREVWNIYQAEALGCGCITAPGDVIKKLSQDYKSAYDQSHETVLTFFRDSTDAGFSL